MNLNSNRWRARRRRAGSNPRICQRLTTGSPSRRSAAGFTLMEIMAAMAILMVIVLMIGRIFTDSNKIWKIGTKRAGSLGEGRAVMDFLVRELSQAFSDTNVSFRLNSENPIYGVTAYRAPDGMHSDELFFVTAVRTPEYSDMRRAAPHHIYFITNMWDQAEQPIPNRYTLVRCRKTGSTHKTPEYREDSAYNDREWWRNFNPVIRYIGGVSQDMEPIAENIAGFEVWAWSESKGKYDYNYDSNDNEGKLPLWVDIYLELFSEEESIQMATLWAVDPSAGGAADQYREKNSRRYAARVFFPNRLGYTKL